MAGDPLVGRLPGPDIGPIGLARLPAGQESGLGAGVYQLVRQFYPAVCSECGQETEVPFAPTPGKPVYCRDCFQARKTSAPRYDY